MENNRYIMHNICIGDICTTPNNLPGRCVLLPQCPYLIYIYGNNPGNNQVIRFLIGSQRNCGNQAIGRDPIVNYAFIKFVFLNIENLFSQLILVFYFIFCMCIFNLVSQCVYRFVAINPIIPQK